MDELVARLLSNENPVRSAAEAEYNTLKESNPSGTFESLLSVLVGNKDASQRSLAAVLAKRLLKNEDNLYTSLSPAARLKTREILLNQLVSDSELTVRKKIAVVIANLANLSHSLNKENASADDGWPQLLGNISAVASNSNRGESDVKNSLAALYTFNYLAEYAAEMILPHGLDFCKVVAPKMSNDTNLDVRVAALEAVCSFLHSKDKIEKEFEELVPGMISVLVAAVEKGEESVVQDTLRTLIDVVEAHPTFLKGYIKSLDGLLTKIAAHEELEEDTRALSLELMISVCEKNSQALRKLPGIVSNLVTLCIDIISHGVEVSELEVNNEETEDNLDDQEQLRTAGEEALARLTKKVGAKTVLPVAFANVEKNVRDQASWKHRTAGLLTVAVLSQNLSQMFFTQLPNIVQSFVAPFAHSDNEKNERVRFTALTTLGTLCYSFRDLDEETKIKCALEHAGQSAEEIDEIEEEHEEQINLAFMSAIGGPILGAVVKALGNSAESWKVRQEACNTVIAFFSAFEEKEVLAPFEQALLQNLFAVMKDSPMDLMSVKIDCLTAVSGIAQVLGEEFGKYYDHFMPIAKEFIQLCAKADGPTSSLKGFEALNLRGKAMDCVGLMGSAVEKTKFEPDAKFALDTLIMGNNDFLRLYDHQLGIKLEGESEEEQDVREYVVRACCRICTTMGTGKTKDFHQYMQYLVPPLMIMAAKDAKVNVDELDEDPDQNITTENGITKFDMHVRGVGARRIEFNTWAAQDKELSCNMLYAYADTFEEYFYPYAVQSIQLLLPEIDSPMYNTRICAILSMPRLLNSMAKGVAKLLNSSENQFFLTEIANPAKAMASLKGQVDVGDEVLNLTLDDMLNMNFNSVQNVFDKMLTGLLECLEEAQAVDGETDDDEELFNDDQEEDEELLEILSESIAALLRQSFESGGQSDNNIDTFLAETYEVEKKTKLQPKFGVASENVEEVLTKIVTGMQNRIEKRMRMFKIVYNEEIDDEDIDQEMVAKLEESDKRMDEFLDNMSEAIGCIIKAQATYISESNTTFLDIFERVCLPLSNSLLQHDESEGVTPHLKAVGFFFYDDVIEHGGPFATKFVDYVAPYMLEASNHPDFLLRQAACFGLSVCAQSPGIDFDKFAVATLDELKKTIMNPKAMKGNQTSATDNAVSAVYKLCIYRQTVLQAHKVDVKSLFESVLNCLPLKTDLIEAKVIHYKIAAHLAKNDAFAQTFGPKIKAVLAKAVKSKKGLNKKTGEYDVDGAILTDNTRKLLQQLGIK